MKSIILASNNKDKVKEVKEILKGYDIISMKEAGIDVDIEENGTTFEKMLCKSKSNYEAYRPNNNGR